MYLTMVNFLYTSGESLPAFSKPEISPCKVGDDFCIGSVKVSSANDSFGRRRTEPIGVPPCSYPICASEIAKGKGHSMVFCLPSISVDLNA